MLQLCPLTKFNTESNPLQAYYSHLKSIPSDCLDSHFSRKFPSFMYTYPKFQKSKTDKNVEETPSERVTMGSPHPEFGFSMCQPFSLRRDQETTIQWMLQREEMEHFGIRGGIIRAEWGLGKTIMSYGLVFASNHRQKQAETLTPTLLSRYNTCPTMLIPESGHPKSDHPIDSITECPLTLIIAQKSSIINTWLEEAVKFFGSFVKVLILHPSLYKSTYRTIARKDLDQYDIVLTTYDVIRSEAKKKVHLDDYKITVAKEEMQDGKKKKSIYIRNRTSRDIPLSYYESSVGGADILFYTPWKRIIADESQVIANQKTSFFKSLMMLVAKQKWCTTATPIRNKELDLHSHFRFLNFRDGHHTEHLTSLWSTDAMERYKLHQHIWNYTYEMAQIKLPKKHIYNIELDFDTTQYELYRCYQQQTKKTIDLVEQGKVKYLQVLACLIRMRQICVASYLTTDADLRSFREGLAKNSVNHFNSTPEQSTPSTSSTELKPPMLNPLETFQSVGLTGLTGCSSIPFSNEQEVDIIENIKKEMEDEYAANRTAGKQDKKSTEKRQKLQERLSKQIIKNIKRLDKLQERTRQQISTMHQESSSTKNEQASEQVVIHIKEHGRKVNNNSFNSSDSDNSDSDDDEPVNIPSDDWIKNRAGTSGIQSPKVVSVLKIIQDLINKQNSSNEIARIHGRIQDKTHSMDVDRLVVFSMFDKALDLIEDAIQTNSVNKDVLCIRIQAKHSSKQRKTLLQQTRTCTDKVIVLLITFGIGAVSWNLQHFNHCIPLEPWWCPSVQTQAEARLHRVGQERETYVYNFIMKNSIEQHVQTTSQHKLDMADKIYANIPTDLVTIRAAQSGEKKAVSGLDPMDPILDPMDIESIVLQDIKARDHVSMDMTDIISGIYTHPLMKGSTGSKSISSIDNIRQLLH